MYTGRPARIVSQSGGLEMTRYVNKHLSCPCGLKWLALKYNMHDYARVRDVRSEEYLSMVKPKVCAMTDGEI